MDRGEGESGGVVGGESTRPAVWDVSLVTMGVRPLRRSRVGDEGAALLEGIPSVAHAQGARWVTGGNGYNFSTSGSRAQFCRAVTILTRTRIPLSFSIDPAGASSSEFTLHSDGLAPREGDDSWLLEITTSQLLYAGNRVERTGRSDGNAASEREALVFAPRLQVEGHREGSCPVPPRAQAVPRRRGRPGVKDAAAPGRRDSIFMSVH